MKSRMSGSDPKFLESILDGFDDFKPSPFMDIKFPYLNDTILAEIEANNHLEKEIRDILTCLDDLETSFGEKITSQDEEVKQFVIQLKEKFYLVFNTEISKQVHDLIQSEEVSEEVKSHLQQWLDSNSMCCLHRFRS